MKRDRKSDDQAESKYENLLGDLHKIARRVPRPPAKRGRGRPAAHGDLYGPVKVLALY